MSNSIEPLCSEHDADEAVLPVSAAELVASCPVATFVIDASHRVIYWNRACEHLTGVPAEDIVGTNKQWMPFYPAPKRILPDYLIDGASDAELAERYQGRARRSDMIAGAIEGHGYFPQLPSRERWLTFVAAPLRDADGRIVAVIETLQDVTQQKRAELELQAAHGNLERLVRERTLQLHAANERLAEDVRCREHVESELRRRNAELTDLNAKLSQAQEQLVQSEKLASIGQLAAGVAHEINNPIGFVFSNFGTLEGYLRDLMRVLEAYEGAERELGSGELRSKLAALKGEVELDYLKEDIPSLMRESREGIARVRKIVQDLKDFSRVDSRQEFESVDLHRGIDSTLNIVNNEIKYKADVVKEYGELPEVECIASQINQVVMNLLVNAAQAMGPKRGRITVRTGAADDLAWIEVGDDGCGIAPENLSRIFDPFFTTKCVGQGTGLGLSLSYGIVQRHGGYIEVSSRLGEGTTFRVHLPIRRAQEAAA